jgi:hypothetical protein
MRREAAKFDCFDIAVIAVIADKLSTARHTFQHRK